MNSFILFLHPLIYYDLMFRLHTSAVILVNCVQNLVEIYCNQCAPNIRRLSLSYYEGLSTL